MTAGGLSGTLVAAPLARRCDLALYSAKVPTVSGQHYPYGHDSPVHHTEARNGSNC
jgi:hypothetical protein